MSGSLPITGPAVPISIPNHNGHRSQHNGSLSSSYNASGSPQFQSQASVISTLDSIRYSPVTPDKLNAVREDLLRDPKDRIYTVYYKDNNDTHYRKLYGYDPNTQEYLVAKYDGVSVSYKTLARDIMLYFAEDSSFSRPQLDSSTPLNFSLESCNPLSSLKSLH